MLFLQPRVTRLGRKCQAVVLLRLLISFNNSNNISCLFLVSDGVESSSPPNKTQNDVSVPTGEWPQTVYPWEENLANFVWDLLRCAVHPTNPTNETLLGWEINKLFIDIRFSANGKVMIDHTIPLNSKLVLLTSSF